MTTISPVEFEELWRRGEPIDLIDVRTPAEYRACHAEPAKLVPLDRLNPSSVMEARNGSKDQPLYLICGSGSRSREAAEKFVAAGYPNVFNVAGGTLAWEQAGLPVSRGKAAMSLERQVRIAAGSLVVIGTALGAFVHPGFLGLSAFVGSGLVFAGVSDTCGMGMILARMPWNRLGDRGSPERVTCEP